MAEVVGKILGIAVRTTAGGEMREVTTATATAGGGLAGDLQSSPNRGLTLLAAGQWSAVNRELKAQLPWHTRRANVLIDAPRLGHLLGRRIVLGQVEVEVRSETKPCELMDKLYAGLRSALVPDMRGGVCCRIIRGGRLQVGDLARFLE